MHGTVIFTLFFAAMTTSKWDLLEQESDGEKEATAKVVDEDIDGALVLFFNKQLTSFLTPSLAVFDKEIYVSF